MWVAVVPVPAGLLTKVAHVLCYAVFCQHTMPSPVLAGCLLGVALLFRNVHAWLSGSAPSGVHVYHLLGRNYLYSLQCNFCEIQSDS